MKVWHSMASLVLVPLNRMQQLQHCDGFMSLVSRNFIFHFAFSFFLLYQKFYIIWKLAAILELSNKAFFTVFTSYLSLLPYIFEYYMKKECGSMHFGMSSFSFKSNITNKKIKFKPWYRNATDIQWLQRKFCPISQNKKTPDRFLRIRISSSEVESKFLRDSGVFTLNNTCYVIFLHLPLLLTNFPGPMVRRARVCILEIFR